MRMVMMIIMYIIAITLLSYRTVINKESAENDKGTVHCELWSNNKKYNTVLKTELHSIK